MQNHSKTTAGAGRLTTTRTISASEIARNVKHFETWSTCHACEQVAFSDLPPELKEDIMSVFDLERKLPISIVKEAASSGQLATLAPELASFIRKANREAPSLFSVDAVWPSKGGSFSELNGVYLAWRQLKWMRKSKEKWSESDFAANVYNVFRTPAIRESAYRNQCTISLPQQLPHVPLTTSSVRVLRAKSVVPDSSVFIRASSIRPLSLPRASPWKSLNNNAKVRKHCTELSESAFRYQSTPCAQPPEHPSFEFASSFWEDKKPNCELLETAYRQNRMATTSAVRHLKSLGVQAPVFGLVWANGTVRAHVDWCSGEGKGLAVHSAPYPGPQSSLDDITVSATSRNTSTCTASSASGTVFHEWSLDCPSDILRVFLLIRNIDTYTSTRFRTRVEGGVKALSAQMEAGEDEYRPWKISAETGVLRPASLNVQPQPAPAPPPPMITGFPTPPQAPRKRVKGVIGKGKGRAGSKTAGRKDRDR